MNKEKYLKMRDALLEEAQGFIDSGDLKSFETKQKEILELDEKFENANNARASMEALVKNPVATNLEAKFAAAGAAPSGTVVARMDDAVEPEDFTDSVEYRKAFMNHVTKGAAMPSKFQNADANTLTTDVASVIPTILVGKIVEKMESTGMILPRVTRTTYAAGVNIPTSTVKPVATWVAEGKGSDRQKKTTGVITFTHHKLRCEISMSMETGTMSIAAFEAAFVRQVAEAMVKSIEQAIVSDSAGTDRPKGILAETPETGQAIDVSALDYKTLVEAEAALPQAYEGGAVWCMTKKTFMGFIGMTDSNGQPIARVNYGIGGSPERTLLGRTVVLCGDYLPSFDAATDGDVFAFLFNFSDYVLNTIYDMGIQRKQDWETEDMLTKAVMSCDGKVVDKNSLVTLAKDSTVNP